MTLATDTSGDNLFHAYLIDLEIAGTTYYISDLFTDYTYESNLYQPLGELMNVGRITNDINPGENQSSIVVSGIAGEVYTVYKGYVRNINFSETFPQVGVTHQDTVIFECSNLFGLKKNTPNGRRCNPDDWNDYTRFTLGYNYDKAMDDVPALNGQKFAFGRTG